MNSNRAPLWHRMFIASLAGAAAIGIAGCENKPEATSISKTFDGAVTEAAPAGDPPVTQAASPTADAVLAARVKSALVDEPTLKQSLAVEVNAAGGVVTLFGTAQSAEKSHHAAIVALNVDGVRSVKNELVVLAGS